MKTMKAVIFKQHVLRLALLAGVLFCAVVPVRATQGARRDHLTPAEVDLVRDTQAIDKRTDVFIKAADRRLLLLTDPQAAQSK